MAQVKNLGLKNEIQGDKLVVSHENDAIEINWPLQFDWSLNQLRWICLDRLGLRNPDNLFPRHFSGGEVEVI